MTQGREEGEGGEERRGDGEVMGEREGGKEKRRVESADCEQETKQHTY